MKTGSRILLLAVLSAAAACRKAPPPPARPAPASPAAVAVRSEPAERHPLKGVIRQVDASRSEITVEHEEVPGYMAAMTMSFPVRDDPQVMGLLRPGDRIEATLAVGKDHYWLEKILTRGFVPTPVAVASAASAATPLPHRSIGPGDPVPDFSLTDQTGHTVQLSKLRGQSVALTFIYTRCPVATACPMTTAKFSQLDALLRGKGIGRLLTITVDPEHDTPQVLAEYAKHVGADPKRWSFLTGPPQDVARVGADLGVIYYPDRGQIVHSLAAAVIDPDGKLSTIYYGEAWQAEHLFRDMTRTVQTHEESGSEKARKG
ncbi:MAG TPA: SCO family protein [Thermoanaerobaculia bacterium]